MKEFLKIANINVTVLNAYLLTYIKIAFYLLLYYYYDW